MIELCANWRLHSCCYLAWAIHPEWGKNALRVKRELRSVITTIAEYEPVKLLVASDRVDDARQQSFGANVEIIEAPVDDIWMRDIIPTFGRRGKEVVAIDWNCNGWGSTRERPARPGDKLARYISIGDDRICAPFVAEGGAFITDSKGTIITTRSCLLNENRNVGKTEIEIEEGFASLGGRQVILARGESGRTHH
jgi:agmatine deiminase